MSENGISRRDLLRMGGAAAAGLAVATNTGIAGARGRKKKKTRTKALPVAGTNLPEDRIGIQLYSVRDQLGTLGFAKLLPRIAEIGFKGVEFAGYNSEKPSDIRKILDDYGLKAIGNHGAMDDASIDAAGALGQPYTGIAFEIPEHGLHTDGWKQLAADYNAFGERAWRQARAKFYVHLHGPAYAVVPDNPLKRGLDVLLEESDPRYFVFEMDIYWAYFFQSYLGGAGLLFDPSEWVRNNRASFPLFHVKDGKEWVKGAAPTGQQMTVQGAPLGGGGSAGPTYPLSDGITDIGQGDVPFKTFFGNMGEVNKHWYLWERDTASANPHGSLTSARASYLMMRNDHMARPSRW